MRLISGADGCKEGWVVVTEDLDTGEIAWELCPTAHDLIYCRPLRLMTAVDIPIGLPDTGARSCDHEARRLLGVGRASSVFPAPVRLVLAAATYEEACGIRLSIEQKKMSQQAWAIVPKVRDIDRVLRDNPQVQDRVREVHPEVSFYFLAGEQPMKYSKKKRAGREARKQLLAPLYGAYLERALADRRALASSTDDILDAFVALWTARRIINKQAQVLPAIPARDAVGLQMEIVA